MAASWAGTSFLDVRAVLRGGAQEGTPEEAVEAGMGHLQRTARHCLSFREWSEESQRSAVLEPAAVKNTKAASFKYASSKMKAKESGGSLLTGAED